MINYHNKKFNVLSNSENGEISAELVFHYQQKGNILSCNYQDKHITKGHLIGLVANNGDIDMSYHQINSKGELVTGVCKSKYELQKNGKIRLHEEWQWTSGDKSKGYSVLEEI